MFQRLATLVIELKERINVLEAKVANLEQGDKGDKRYEGDKLGGYLGDGALRYR